MSTTNRLHPPGKPNIFGLPVGFLGALAGWIMGRTGQGHNEWAVAGLHVRPGDSVLEIGFGPGVGIGLLAQRATSGFVAGVDPSPVMLRQARKRNAAAVQAGRVDLREGSASALPFGDRRFDRVLSVNNIMMWPDLPESLGEVYRVLKPGGMVGIALNPRWAKSAAGVHEMGREIIGHLTLAGFVEAQVAFSPDLKPFGAVLVTARVRSGSAASFNV